MQELARRSAGQAAVLAHNATRVVLVEIGVARPTGRAEAKAKVAASARDWEEEEHKRCMEKASRKRERENEGQGSCPQSGSDWGVCDPE